MSIRSPLTRALVLAVVLLQAACFKLSRESPPVQQFVLSSAVPIAGSAPTASAAATAGVSMTGQTLGLRRLDAAPYLAVPGIVVRRGLNEVVVSEFHRWGEHLEDGINRVVAENLTSVPPIQAVDVAPWRIGARHTFVVQLHVSRFEGVADSAATQGRVHMMANWDIISPRTGVVLVRGTSDDRGGVWRVGDYAGLVVGLDAALQRLANDIRTCVSGFRNDSTPPASACR